MYRVPFTLFGLEDPASVPINVVDALTLCAHDVRLKVSSCAVRNPFPCSTSYTTKHGSASRRICDDRSTPSIHASAMKNTEQPCGAKCPLDCRRNCSYTFVLAQSSARQNCEGIYQIEDQ